jgi:hypothetical protein
VARLGHSGIGLVEPGRRAGMAAGLADLVDGAATADLVSVLAVQVRVMPDDGAERAGWRVSHARADAPELARTVDAAATRAVTGAAVRREAYLTVVVPDQRLGRHNRRGGVEARARQLYAVAAEIGARLAGQVGCTDVRWLDAPELAAAVRAGFAPGDRGHLTATEPTTGPMSGVPLAAAGPTRAVAPGARHYDHDGWSSVAYTLLLPDKGAVMGALAPVLAPAVAGETRALTVFYAPFAPAVAHRLVGRDAISAGTSAQVRSRLGFATRAAHRRDAARVAG